MSWIFKAMAFGFASLFLFECRGTEEHKYLAIDVSGGPEATSYPVTMLADVPDGGWTDEYKTTKIVLRRCPKGTDPLGSYMLTQDFYAGVFEVTKAQWELVTGTSPWSWSMNETEPAGYVSYDMIRGSDKGSQWPASPDVDAGSFIGRLRAKTRLATLDLPTEAQWEYACRAGTTTEYNTGDGEEDLARAGWYWIGTGGFLSTHAMPVGQKQANGWGLYDMHGNVWEWCLNRENGNLTGADPKGAESGDRRYSCGGDYSSVALRCTCRSRFFSRPSESFGGHGFRLFGTTSTDTGTIPVLAGYVPVRAGYVLNVRARQLWPHNLVEVCYELGDDIRKVAGAKFSLGCGERTVKYSKGGWRWTHDESNPWKAEASLEGEGNVWRSGEIGGGMKSGISAMVGNAREVRFRWKVDSEQRFDWLRFYVNGVERGKISGSGDGWQDMVVELNPEQASELRWEYEKDGSIDVGEDCGWISGVEVAYESAETTARTVIGDASCTPGEHRVIWDMEADGVEALDYGLEFTVAYGIASGTSEGIEVDTTGEFMYDGMEVGYEFPLRYSAVGGGEVTVKVDGEPVATAEESGEFWWQPTTVGEHTVTHETGGVTWERVVNVTYTLGGENESPEPPEDPNPSISLGSEKRNFGADGGSYMFRVNGSGTWSATASASWIKIATGSSGTGSGLLRYTVEANATDGARTGYVYVGGHSHKVIQAGQGWALAVQSVEVGCEGGYGTFELEAPDGAEWMAYSGCDWISVDLEYYWGCGAGTVRYFVAPHDGILPDRTGAIVAGGMEYTVTQKGKALKLGKRRVVCSSAEFETEVEVASRAGEDWGIDAGSVPDWIEAVRAGNAVWLRVAENTGTFAREGELRIGTETLTVEQSGRVETLWLDPESIVYESGEFATGEIRVETRGGTAVWKAAESTGGESMMIEAPGGEILPDGSVFGRGDGAIEYWLLDALPKELPRTVWVEVEGRRTYITQRGGAVALEATGMKRNRFAGSGAIGVFAEAGVKWNVLSTVDWITVRTESGSGNGEALIEWAENTTGAERKGKVLVAGEEYEFTQTAGETDPRPWTIKSYGHLHETEWVWVGGVVASRDGKWRMSGSHPCPEGKEEWHLAWERGSSGSADRLEFPAEVEWTDDDPESETYGRKFVWDVCIGYHDRWGGFSEENGFAAKEVAIPREVKRVAGGAFEGSTTITNFSIATRIVPEAVIGEENLGLKEITIGEGAEVIEDDAFFIWPLGAAVVDTVRISGTVREIGNCAFMLPVRRFVVDEANVDFGVGDEGALYELDNRGGKVGLIKVPADYAGSEFVVPETVCWIAGGAFCGCVNVTKVRIGGMVEWVEPGVFAGSSVAEASVDPENPNYKDVDGVLYYYRENGQSLEAYPPKRPDRKLVVPEGTGSISDAAFYLAENLEEVELPASMEYIGDDAFGEARKLAEVTVRGEGGYLYVGDYAFGGLPKLKELDLGRRDVLAASNAFEDSAALERVRFWNLSLSGEDEWASSEIFDGCTALTDVYCYGDFGYDAEEERLNGRAAFARSFTLHVTKGSSLPASILDSNSDGSETWTVTVVKDLDPWIPAGLGIEGDDGAEVFWREGVGIVVIPSEGVEDVALEMPEGFAAWRVTVEVGVGARTVKSSWADVRVVSESGGVRHDITEWLDIPRTWVDGVMVVEVGEASVKEAVAKEVLDAAKGAVLKLGGAATELTTAPTKPGLKYTLREGETLEGMRDGASKVGDGEKWTPAITVKGGRSGFYSIRVEK